MSSSPRIVRKDAKENKCRLLHAAQALFAERGSDLPLEEVASAAGVSRATLYRHFPTREDLIAAVFEENVTGFEAMAANLGTRRGGILDMLSYVFDAHENNRHLAHIITQSQAPCIQTLRSRTAVAITPLVEQGKRDSVLRDDIDVADVMTTLTMVGAVTASTERARARELALRAVLANP